MKKICKGFYYYTGSNVFYAVEYSIQTQWTHRQHPIKKTTTTTSTKKSTKVVKLKKNSKSKNN